MEITSLDSKVATIEDRVAQLCEKLVEFEQLLAKTKTVRQALVKEREGVTLPDDYLGPIPFNFQLSHGLSLT